MADTESVVNELAEFAAKKDFDGAFKLIKTNGAELAKQLQAAGIRDALKKTTSDRNLISFLDAVFGVTAPLKDSLYRLEKLISFAEGSLVLNSTWGLGKVKRVDYFYKRITVDFKTKRGHQFTYGAAIDMLERAPENHILVMRECDPTAFEQLLKEKKGDFIKKVIESNGSSMTMIKLEDYCINNGFVKSVNWKKFWDEARVELKRDLCVVIPVKKTEPILIKAAAEDYGDNWLTVFSHETDPKIILADVKEYVDEGKFRVASEEVKTTIGERLVFAITAAKLVDDALYARLAYMFSNKLQFTNPSSEELRAYLWERKRYIKAAVELPAHDVGDMIKMLGVDDESKGKLYAALPEFCFAAVTEIVDQFKTDDNCRKAIGKLMQMPDAPATLTTLIIGKYEQFKEWKELPSLITLLSHAIALGEGRRSGEILRMQNIIRRLFGNTDWLKKVFGWLTPEEQACFFERFQASIAWDPSTHHTIVVRMTKIVPELEAHVVKIEKKREYARLTSYRSFGLKKQEYLKLINEDMPANVKRIEFAKSYGDLSENAEYQYAKDEQRALMQKQTLMQADLEAVKPGDFADATTDEVMPGVTVVALAKDGEKRWTILGEWDNDLEKGIISSKTKVAQNLMGKKVGEDFELPDTEGKTTFATVKEILPLTDDIREWMKLPAGIQI